jgi:hypothetical protein
MLVVMAFFDTAKRYGSSSGLKGRILMKEQGDKYRGTLCMRRAASALSYSNCKAQASTEAQSLLVLFTGSFVHKPVSKVLAAKICQAVHSANYCPAPIPCHKQAKADITPPGLSAANTTKSSESDFYRQPSVTKSDLLLKPHATSPTNWPSQTARMIRAVHSDSTHDSVRHHSLRGRGKWKA